MTMSFQRIDKYRDQSLQPLAADAVCRLPQHNHCLPNGLIVDTVAPLLRDNACVLEIQGPDGVLTVESGQRYELVENLLLFGLRCASIPRADGRGQLLACGHAHSPLLRHLVPPAGPSGG